MAGWNNFRSVVSGFEVVNEEPVPAIQFEAADEQSLPPTQTANEDEDAG